MVAYRQRSTSYNYLTAIVLGSGGFYFGYYIACFNPMFEPLMYGVYGYDKVKDKSLMDTYNGLLNMLFAIGAMIGVLFTGGIADKIGRRPILYAGEVIALLCMLLYFPININCLMVARVISGLVAGINSSIFSVMMAEMLPNAVCGFGNGFSYLSLTLAILLSYSTQNIFSYDTLASDWRYFMLWPAVISVGRLLLFPIFVRSDTPKYLFINSKQDEEISEPRIRNAFSLVYIADDVAAVTTDAINQYKKELSQGQITLGMLFGPKFRKRLISGCFVTFAQQASGINFLIFYSNNLFSDLNANVKVMTLIVGLNNFIGSILVILLIGSMGRKFNLVVGPIAQGIAMFILYIGNEAQELWILAVATCLYMIMFAIGLGGTLTAYVGEILPPIGVGVAFAVQWIMTALIGQFVPNLVSLLSAPRLVLVFGVMCILLAFGLDYLTIETKDKSEAAIAEEFENGTYKFMNLRPKSKNQDREGQGEKHIINQDPYTSIS